MSYFVLVYRTSRSFAHVKSSSLAVHQQHSYNQVSLIKTNGHASTFLILEFLSSPTSCAAQRTVAYAACAVPSCTRMHGERPGTGIYLLVACSVARTCHCGQEPIGAIQLSICRLASVATELTVPSGPGKPGSRPVVGL